MGSVPLPSSTNDLKTIFAAAVCDHQYGRNSEEEKPLSSLVASLV